VICFVEYIAAYHELLGYIAAGLGAISFLPQLIKIWRFHSVKDISTGMYVIYAVSVILWLIYGIIINSEPLILAEILTLILVSAILAMNYMWK
jgi:MtN3 and saliva related transmembrane protein